MIGESYAKIMKKLNIKASELLYGKVVCFFSNLFGVTRLKTYHTKIKCKMQNNILNELNNICKSIRTTINGKLWWRIVKKIPGNNFI